MLPAVALLLILAVGGSAVVLGRRQRSAAVPAATRPEPVPFEGGSVVDRLVHTLRHRRSLRVALSLLSVALLLGAGAMIGYPFYTNVYQSRVQSRLDRQLASPELRQAYLERTVQEGDSLTRIIIPRLDVDVVVVEGTSASALRAGAGHYPSTPLPCEVGNVAIAGHRTTYGRPFHSVDLLEPGDTVILETPIGRCTYEVEAAPFIVAPTDLSVVANTPDSARLTLTSCHPKGSARQRIIVQATMINAESFEA